MILNTNLVQFVQLVRTGLFRKMQYVAIIMGESLLEAQVGSNENLAQELKDSLEVRFTKSLFLKINQSINRLFNQSINLYINMIPFAKQFYSSPTLFTYSGVHVQNNVGVRHCICIHFRTAGRFAFTWIRTGWQATMLSSG